MLFILLYIYKQLNVNKPHVKNRQRKEIWKRVEVKYEDTSRKGELCDQTLHTILTKLQQDTGWQLLKLKNIILIEVLGNWAAIFITISNFV